VDPRLGWADGTGIGSAYGKPSISPAPPQRARGGHEIAGGLFRAVSGGAAGRALICSIFLLSISLLSFWATDKAEQAAAGPRRQGEEIDRRISLPGPYHQGDPSPFVRWLDA
jgi:hypothetical protein